MQPRQRLGQPLLILHQPPKTRCPRQISLHNPSPWQEHKASLRFFVLYDLQRYAVSLRFFRGSFSGVALIHEGDLHRLARGFLHPIGLLAHISPLLFVGRTEE